MSIQQNFKKLGFDHNATAQEAKDAYKTLVRIWHPDQFSNDPVFKARAEEKLKEINVAYSEIKFFLSLQDKPYPFHNTGFQKLVLTISACGDIAWRIGTNFFERLHQLYVHAYSGYGTKDELSGPGAFTEPGPKTTRFRENIGHELNEFQHVLDDVIREKTQPRGFEN